MKELLQYLKCLITNKNQIICSKASGLCERVKDMALRELFEKGIEKCLSKNVGTIDCELLIKEIEKANNNDDHNSNSKNSNLVLTVKEKFIQNKNINNRANLLTASNVSNLKNRETAIKKKKSISVLEDFNNRIEETILSDASINSYKTDCEETVKKAKIRIHPLDKTQIYSILSNYFATKNCVSEENLEELLRKGLAVVHSHKDRNLHIKFKYMRKRVCCKIYAVFEKIVNF